MRTPRRFKYPSLTLRMTLSNLSSKYYMIHTSVRHKQMICHKRQHITLHTLGPLDQSRDSKIDDSLGLMRILVQLYNLAV